MSIYKLWNGPKWVATFPHTEDGLELAIKTAGELTPIPFKDSLHADIPSVVIYSTYSDSEDGHCVWPIHQALGND